MSITSNVSLSSTQGLPRAVARICADAKRKLFQEFLAGSGGISIALAFWCVGGDISATSAGVLFATVMLLHSAWLVLSYPRRVLSRSQWHELLSLGITSKVGYTELNNYFKENGCVHVYQLETVFKERGASWARL